MLRHVSLYPKLPSHLVFFFRSNPAMCTILVVHRFFVGALPDDAHTGIAVLYLPSSALMPQVNQPLTWTQPRIRRHSIGWRQFKHTEVAPTAKRLDSTGYITQATPGSNRQSDHRDTRTERHRPDDRTERNVEHSVMPHQLPALIQGQSCR